MVRILAFQIAKQIQLKEFRKAFAAQQLSGDSWEAFYAFGEGSFAVFEYGADAFFALDALEQSKILGFLQPFCLQKLTVRLSEGLDVAIAAGEMVVGHTSVTVPELKPETLRILMTHVAQSVALDFFAAEADALLADSKALSLTLERTGRIGLRSGELVRYIARSMNLKHAIVSSLYILDSPEATWESEELDRLDRALKRTFDVQSRYRSIVEDIQMVQENLDLFRELAQHRKSTLLEWIIILLVLTEVLNMIVEKFWRLR